MDRFVFPIIIVLQAGIGLVLMRRALLLRAFAVELLRELWLADRNLEELGCGSKLNPPQYPTNIGHLTVRGQALGISYREGLPRRLEEAEDADYG